MRSPSQTSIIKTLVHYYYYYFNTNMAKLYMFAGLYLRWDLGTCQFDLLQGTSRMCAIRKFEMLGMPHMRADSVKYKCTINNKNA